MFDGGWDPTPGIVSVWAEWDGRAIVWRRVPETGELVREDVRFKPWVLLDSLEPLGAPSGHFRYRELDGPGEYLVTSGRSYLRDLPFDVFGACSSISNPPGSMRQPIAVS